MALPFTIYHRPDGRKSEHEMQHITPEDEAWYRDNNIKVSMEELPNGTISVWAFYGVKDNEDMEYLYLVPKGETCEESMKKIRHEVEKLMEQL